MRSACLAVLSLLRRIFNCLDTLPSTYKELGKPFFKSLDKRTKNSTCNCVCCRCCKSIVCQFGLTAIFITNNGRKAFIIEKSLRSIDFVSYICYNSKYFVGDATRALMQTRKYSIYWSCSEKQFFSPV